MNSSRLGMCVVGLGVGYEHAKAYAKMDGVDLFVCDTDPARIEKVRSELKVSGAFTSIDEALASSSVHAIDASLPNNLHATVAMSAARHGKHCLMEKPFAINLKETDAMIAEAKKAGTVLGTGENWQFSPFNLKGAELIKSGAIGKVFFVSVQSEMWPIYFSHSSWWFRRELAGGGVLLCAGVHAIRTLRMLGGSDIRDLYAIGTNISLGIESEDTCDVSLRFENGSLGSVIASWATPHAPYLFEVHGSEGTLINSRHDGLIIKANKANSDRNERFDIPKVDTIEEECKVFVSSIRSGRTDPRISPEEGRKDIEFVEAAYRSMSEGKPVALPL